MNTFAELKEIWTGHRDEAIKSIENILSTTPNNKETEDFLTLVNWLLFTNINPYTFLPKEYAEYKYNPSVALELINNLKQALLDGDVSFVKMFYDNKLWQVLMIFADSSNPNFNSCCIKENYWTVDSILYGAESVLRMKEYKLKSQASYAIIIKYQQQKTFNLLHIKTQSSLLLTLNYIIRHSMSLVGPLMIEHNDKSKAICFNCKDVVATTFLYKDVPFSDGSGVVKNILAAVCDVCGEVVATPAQSTEQIKEDRKVCYNCLYECQITL